MKLPNFWKWRQPNHEFVNLQDVCETKNLIQLKSDMAKPYPDMARKVYDYVSKELGDKFTYGKASMFFQDDLRQKYNLNGIQ